MTAVQPSLWDHLTIDPTPAMLRGTQTVDQCGWCGTVIVAPDGRRPRRCPCCDQRGQSDGTWWAQSLPIAGLTARPATEHPEDP